MSHFAQYQYCGPGTNLAKRLKRNDPGINELDRACKEHDIAYTKTTSTRERNHFDDILARKAWKRVKSSDASIGERAVALSVAGIMKAKSKLGAGVIKLRKRKKSKVARKTIVKKRCKSGMGLRKRRQTKKKVSKRKTIKKKRKPKVNNLKKIKQLFKQAVKSAKHQITLNNPESLNDATRIAIGAAKRAVNMKKKITKKDVVSGLSRVIPIPKIGGALPLIPIFAALSALGALMGGSAGVTNAVINANSAKNKLSEAERHNQTIEAIALGKSVKNGNGLYVSPYKKGYGLYVKPYEYYQQSKN